MANFYYESAYIQLLPAEFNKAGKKLRVNITQRGGKSQLLLIYAEASAYSVAD